MIKFFPNLRSVNLGPGNLQLIIFLTGLIMDKKEYFPEKLSETHYAYAYITLVKNELKRSLEIRFKNSFKIIK